MTESAAVPAEVPTLVEAVATALQDQITDVTSALRDRLSTRIEELHGDTGIIDLLYASIMGNVENIVNSLRLHIDVGHIEPPSAAYEYARRLAQRGVPVSALVRAYRLGQQNLLELVFAECHRIDADPDTRAAAYEEIVAFTFDHIDWISQGVITVYEAERERWLAERDSARAGRVEDILVGKDIDVDTAEGVIGYRLRVPHLGAVLWVHETGAQQDQLSRFTRAAAAIAQLLGSRRPLLIPRDRASAWAWFAVGEDVTVDPSAVRSAMVDIDGPPLPMVAFGTVASGLVGFRSTHFQAVQAQRVAMVGDDAHHPVVSFDEPGLKVAALLAHDLESTRAWVWETLGVLASDDEQHERLRHTLLQFFQNDSSYTATAEAMLMHKNSIKYRLASAEKALSRSIGSDRQAIELALTACRWLGPAVLRSPE